MDFNNINKSCPKQSFPRKKWTRCLIPYQDFNHRASWMHSQHITKCRWKEKMKGENSFIIGDTYYYKAMCFTFTNVGVTYQHLMTKVFQHQIKRKIEVYSSNMLVNSTRAFNHLEAFEENFKMF